MKNELYDAFDSLRAEDSLREVTRQRMARKRALLQRRRRMARVGMACAAALVLAVGLRFMLKSPMSGQPDPIALTQPNGATPTATATADPTATPTVQPTDAPTATPTVQPTDAPTAQPTVQSNSKEHHSESHHD